LLWGETIEEFYRKLNELIKETSRKDVLIVTGDWNAKVGEDREGWEEVMGQYGFGKRNERGEIAEVCNYRSNI